MAVSELQVQTALKELVDPNTHKDYVSTKSARNIKIDGGAVSVDILLSYPAQSQLAAHQAAGRRQAWRHRWRDQRHRKCELQDRFARRAARRQADPQRQEHHRRGLRQGRRRQVHHRGQPGAGAGRRRRARRHARRRHLRAVAADHARASPTSPNPPTARTSSR